MKFLLPIVALMCCLFAAECQAGGQVVVRRGLFAPRAAVVAPRQAVVVNRGFFAPRAVVVQPFVQRQVFVQPQRVFVQPQAFAYPQFVAPVQQFAAPCYGGGIQTFQSFSYGY